MILRRLTIAALVAIASVGMFTPAQAQEATMAGDWTGTLSTPNGPIDLIFKVVEDEDGALSTTLDVPTQGVAGIVAGATFFHGSSRPIGPGPVTARNARRRGISSPSAMSPVSWHFARYSPPARR